MDRIRIGNENRIYTQNINIDQVQIVGRQKPIKADVNLISHLPFILQVRFTHITLEGVCVQPDSIKIHLPQQRVLQNPIIKYNHKCPIQKSEFYIGYCFTMHIQRIVRFELNCYMPDDCTKQILFEYSGGGGDMVLATRYTFKYGQR